MAAEDTTERPAMSSPSFQLGEKLVDQEVESDNSTGDEGAAERAASVVLDLSQIARGRSQVDFDDDKDGPGTGEPTPTTEGGVDDSGVERKLVAASSQLSQLSGSSRRPSLLSRNSSTASRRLSIRRTSLQMRRQNSSSTVGHADGLPSDCRAQTSPQSP